MRAVPTKLFCLAATLLLLAPLPRAWAWGVEGHEVVAALAARHLTPKATAQVAALLGGQPQAVMIADANWADEIRDQRPQTARWHFVNISISARGYDGRHDCAGGNCVVAQIDRDIAVLGNTRLPPARRAEALRFLIHFVADVHQPLHTADNDDRGGNDIHLRWRGQDMSMHRLWDTEIVEASGHDPIMLAGRIGAGVPPATWRAWQSGTPAAWADQSLHLAQSDVYALTRGRRFFRLDRDYVAREAPVARIQLARAAARLAWLLNRTLK
ncbi:MAG: S1/P1 nuclease [Alphaproteobacteria bacterium]|nr:S1/P1 nuclease [Alphaproteobacteria bacterium]